MELVFLLGVGLELDLGLRGIAARRVGEWCLVRGREVCGSVIARGGGGGVGVGVGVAIATLGRVPWGLSRKVVVVVVVSSVGWVVRFDGLRGLLYRSIRTRRIRVANVALRAIGRGRTGLRCAGGRREGGGASRIVGSGLVVVVVVMAGTGGLMAAGCS